jgi:hypothetical protein
MAQSACLVRSSSHSRRYAQAVGTQTQRRSVDSCKTSPADDSLSTGSFKEVKKARVRAAVGTVDSASIAHRALRLAGVATRCVPCGDHRIRWRFHQHGSGRNLRLTGTTAWLTLHCNLCRARPLVVSSILHAALKLIWSDRQSLLPIPTSVSPRFFSCLSRFSRVASDGDCPTAMAGSMGALCVTGTTMTAVMPSLARSTGSTMTSGRSLRSSSCPPDARGARDKYRRCRALPPGWG